MKRPRIAIDTSYMDRRPGKGTAIVIRHSVEELLQYKNEFDITLIHRESIPEEPLYKEFKEIIIRRLPLPKYAGILSELWFFLTTRERFDIYYFSYSRLLPTFWLAPARRIVFAAMDGGPQTAGYEGKAKGKHAWWVRIFFWRVNAFVALTEFGKRGIVETYKLNPAKVHIVPNGVNEHFLEPVSEARASETLKKYALPQSYILCVSRFDPHKNIIRLLEAYAELKKLQESTPPLVFVGGRHMPDYSAEIDRTIEALCLQESIVVAPFIDEEDLPAIYASAELMVFPSLYEGFGLPVIETMATGTPLVISNIDALTEVSGGFAEIVDPYDVHDIARGMNAVLQGGSEIKERVEKGKVWITRYTWKSHGDALAAIFSSVVH